MPLPSRVLIFLSVVFIAWGLIFQAMASHHTATADASIRRYREDLASITRQSKPTSTARHGASDLPSVAVIAKSRWHDAIAEIEIAVEETARTARQLGDMLGSVRATETTAAEKLDQAKRELRSRRDNQAAREADMIHPTSTGIGAADLANVDAIVEGNNYGADMRAAGLHREALQLGAKVATLAELFCSVQNWRNFLDPFIKAVERRPDRMLYNYI